MTAIVGVTYGRHVLLGGDSCVTTGDGVGWHRSPAPKVWAHADGWVCGFAGHALLGIACRNRLVLPKPPLPDQDLGSWAEAEIPDAVTRALSSVIDGFAAYLGDEEDPSLDLLIGLRGRLYIYTYPGLVTRAQGHAAIGTGADVALGSLAETRHLPPRERVRRALTRAEERILAVRRPWKWATV